MYVKVVARSLAEPACAELRSVDVGADGRTLSVGWHDDRMEGDTFDHAEVTETADEVRIGIVVQRPNGISELTGSSGRATVILSAPLGNRRIVDVQTGERVRPHVAG